MQKQKAFLYSKAYVHSSISEYHLIKETCILKIKPTFPNLLVDFFSYKIIALLKSKNHTKYHHCYLRLQRVKCYKNPFDYLLNFNICFLTLISSLI